MGGPLFGGERMAGKAEYKNQWQKANCDRVNLTLPKGRKAELQAHATAQGESVNGFIGRAIVETMERDGIGGPQRAVKLAAVAGAVSSMSPAALKAVQAAIQPTAAAQMAAASLSPKMLETVQIAAGATGEAVEEFLVRAVQTQAQRDRSSIALGINPATGDKIMVNKKK